MRIVLVGGAGQVGGWVADHLRELGHRVIAADVVAGAHPDDVVVDACDRRALTAAMAGCDLAVHGAAVVPRGDRGEDPALVARAWAVNVGSVAVWLWAARQAEVPALVHLSTMSVFADYGVVPVDPDGEPDSVETYPWSKRVAEGLCREHAARSGVPITSLRLAFPTSDAAAPWWVRPGGQGTVTPTLADGTPLAALPARDVAAAVVACADHRGLWRALPLTAAPESLSLSG